MSDFAYVPGVDPEHVRRVLAGEIPTPTIESLYAEVIELRDHLRKQQEAFIIGLELAQRTADAQIAEVTRERDEARAALQAAITDVRKFCEERNILAVALAEAEATILNERGEGTPPGEGWEPSLHNSRVRWGRDIGEADYLIVREDLTGPGWGFRRRHPDGRAIGADGIFTARAAMQSADLALKEPK